MAVTDSRMIGVIDLQGGVAEHLNHLNEIGVAARAIKHVAELDGLSGLIIPGGESTCLSKLMRSFGLDCAIKRAYDNGLKVWGTCAGAILLATEDTSGAQPFFGFIDMVVDRNAFGSQLDSFSCNAKIPAVVEQDAIPLTFIRAPKIIHVGKGVRVLLKMNDNYIAAAESDRILVTVFHPELTASLAFHRYFASKCNLLQPSYVEANNINWTPKSWMRFSSHV
jgi:5'-phosphate synthase pdxT subunit